MCSGVQVLRAVPYRRIVQMREQQAVEDRGVRVDDVGDADERLGRRIR